jgi:hypothetical protein
LVKGSTAIDGLSGSGNTIGGTAGCSGTDGLLHGPPSARGIIAED